MKKSMLILLLMFLMSACDDTENSQKIGENPSVQTTQETLAVTDLTTAEKAVIREKTTTQATTVIDFENSAKFQIETKSFEETTAEIPEIQPKTTESQTTVTVSENTEEKRSDDSAAAAETTDIPQKTDYEKALEIYNFMRENGSGTCINYACRTYEMCQNVGLPCYIVWTNAGMYGHAANTVEIGDIWYILDTQGGYFLDYNYGFTEVVDIDGNHIADGDMLSNYSYDELN